MRGVCSRSTPRCDQPVKVLRLHRIVVDRDEQAGAAFRGDAGAVFEADPGRIVRVRRERPREAGAPQRCDHLRRQRFIERTLGQRRAR
jgi:hypothetical protein